MRHLIMLFGFQNNLKNDANFIKFHQISYNDLDFKIHDNYNLNEGELFEFRDAFIKRMKKRGLYHENGEIKQSNNNLFKINFFIPNNASIGNYLINLRALNKDLSKNPIDGDVKMNFIIKHLTVNKFFSILNDQYTKTYAILLLILAFLNIFIIKFLMKNE